MYSALLEMKKHMDFLQERMECVLMCIEENQKVGLGCVDSELAEEKE